MHNIQLAALQIVQQVMVDGRNLNQVLDESLRRKSVWTPAQRAALQDLSYGTLRFYGQLNAVLDLLLHKHMTDQRITYLLLVALYQLQYTKAAQHAVVDYAVRSADILNPKIRGLVNAILRNFLRNQADLLVQAALKPEGQYSHQQWWIDELRAQYGERAAAILDAGNQHPPMTLRINQRHGTTADYLAQLAEHGLSARLIAPDALQLDKPVSVDKVPGFFSGRASVQDAGAQYAARVLDVHDGMRVLDACAAPGGKTAHILELADVEMVALDKDEKRLTRVAENLQRLELSATLLVGDAAQAEDWWDGKPFERILADVPCSATGVVRRHPDIKWLRRKKDIASFAAQQSGILQSLWPLLAQEGKLLYATCSIFKQENQDIIDEFLKKNPGAQQQAIGLPDGALLPNDEHDGFFYALLQKTA
ncbi:MAG: 16S rRNA (cytosine(967)-C(5))-methyltransferase RsmB [Gallionella sp.]|nr:16S rRNA (cytosine(967)-C(5))-methyltransferase RsmB [Gallionella sp.]MDP1941283.1 16S rRNA (cytosine(967)-C(5))-methyltransferase RsmB [Gallionella sp.]